MIYLLNDGQCKYIITDDYEYTKLWMLVYDIENFQGYPFDNADEIALFIFNDFAGWETTSMPQTLECKDKGFCCIDPDGYEDKKLYKFAVLLVSSKELEEELKKTQGYTTIKIDRSEYHNNKQ